MGERQGSEPGPDKERIRFGEEYLQLPMAVGPDGKLVKTYDTGEAGTEQHTQGEGVDDTALDRSHQDQAPTQPQGRDGVESVDHDANS